MSQHPSLKSKGKEKAHRSVWKRFERLKFLSEKGKWSERDSVYGLEKIKLLKVKIKKEKAAAAEGAVAVEAAQGIAPQAGKGVPAAIKGAAARPMAGKEEAKGASKSQKK